MHKLQIIHHPYGTDHPYLPGPDERTPRDPIGGDMVGIGFLTMPGRAAETVRLCWNRNGRRQAPIFGRPVALGSDHDRWLVELGTIEAGDTVDYWIEVEGAGSRIATPHYTFVARRWRRLAGLTATAETANGLHGQTIGDDGQPGPLITLQRLATGGVQIGLGEQVEDSQAWEPLAAATVAVADSGAQLAIDGRDGRLRVQFANHPLTLRLRWLEESDGRLVAAELSGDLADDEILVGFGERFDALDQRGRAPDIMVYEQYKNQGNRTYLPIPFFSSNRGFGCLVEGSAHVAYDLGRSLPDRWRCMAQTDGSGSVRVDFFAGTPLAQLQAMTARTGRPAEPPPAWAFGPWMSSNEWNNQARVEREVALTRQHKIPATVLVLEAWSDETTFYIWNGATYEANPGDWVPQLADFRFPADGPWPNPQAMSAMLREAGIHLILWQIPALKQIEGSHAQHDADVAHALEQGYVLRHSDGTPYRNPAFWFNGAHIPDFTSPAASEWWMQKRAYLLNEMGVDGFKTDGGEHLQGRTIRASDGRSGNELVNSYPNLYIGTYHRFTRQQRGKDGITFSRAGHTGAGAFPAHWAGDENSTWEAYQRSIVAGLSAGLSGIPFWAWDIAGFSDDLPTAELFLRATAMAAFCPLMQYHSEYTPPGAASKDRTPWRVQQHTGDERVIPLYRHYAHLRMNLLPYLVREAAQATTSGEPLMRALLLDYPDDPIAWRIADQYLLGRDLLVAPIVEEGATTRRLYLPPGTWHDLWADRTYTGGSWIEREAPLEQIPVFVRAGAILPLNLGQGEALATDVGNAIEPERLSLWIYPAEGSSAEFVVADQSYRIEVEQTPTGTNIRLPALPIPCHLRLSTGQRIDLPPNTAMEWERIPT
jgi:alpha-glucosidase (family GH31 glycosyl hydrolase)